MTDPTKLELVQKADILERVLTLAKQNYAESIGKHEKSDAEAMLEKLDTVDNSTTSINSPNSTADAS